MSDPQHDDAQSAQIRASDSEREAVVEQLNRHAGDGRLTLDELAERIEHAFEAKTRAELVPLTRDLPGGQVAAAQHEASPPANRREPVRWDVAIMGGNERKGRFRIKDKFHALAIMGGSDIDLRNAEIDGDVTVNVIAIMGGSSIYVPDNVEVEIGGFAIMGGESQRGSNRPTPPHAPVLRINAYSLMGGNEIWRLPAESRGKSLKEAKKAAKRLERGDEPPQLSS